MEKRWNVYHGSEYLGLKTAKEIREALRRGTLDAFDRVSLEGSNIREDLIDVDEIFKENTGVFAEDPNGTVVATRPQDYEAVMPQRAQAAPAAASAAAQEYNWRAESSAMRQKAEVAQAEALKTPVKRYYILDREKVLGPLSAHEIQSLYNRGVLTKTVKVQKIGGKRTMSIAQFIASYSGDRLKELTEDGKIPQQIGVGSPSSKVLTELARMASSRKVAQQRQQRTILIGVAVAVLLGLAAFLLVQVTNNKGPSSEPASRVQMESPVDVQQTPPLRTSRPRLIQKEAPPIRPTPVEIQEPLRKAASKPAKALPSATAKKTVRSAPQVSRPAATPRPPVAVVKKPLPEPTPAPAPPKAPAPVPAIPTSTPILATSPIARAIAAAGRIQTVGPVSFQLSALDECAAKCTLTMRDPSGANMKVVFFKNAYYETLKGRSKSLTVTGSTKMERGELTLIIQDVR